MLAINENRRQQRKPACGQCGGTGYVYLWSVSRSGSREWYCDRSRCKRSWSEAKPIVAAPAIDFVGALKSVLPVFTRVGQSDFAAAGGGKSSGAARLVAHDSMADRVSGTSSWRWSVHAPHG